MAVENVRDSWEQLVRNRSYTLTAQMLGISSLLPDRSKGETADIELTEEYLNANLQLTTNESFEQLCSVFLHSNEFTDRIESIEPLLTNRQHSVALSPSRQLINKRVEAFDRIERIRNHSKVNHKPNHSLRASSKSSQWWRYPSASTSTG